MEQSRPSPADSYGREGGTSTVLLRPPKERMQSNGIQYGSTPNDAAIARPLPGRAPQMLPNPIMSNISLANKLWRLTDDSLCPVFNISFLGPIGRILKNCCRQATFLSYRSVQANFRRRNVTSVTFLAGLYYPRLGLELDSTPTVQTLYSNSHSRISDGSIRVA